MKFILILIVFALCISGNAKAQTAHDSTATIKIKVKGIICNMDFPLIKKKLINQEGVDEVAFSEIKSGAVVCTVTYHPLIISEEKISKAIEAAPSCENPNQYPYRAKVLPSNKKKT